VTEKDYSIYRHRLEEKYLEDFA